MIIRKANIDDIERINDIYNQAVLNTTATIDTEPRPLEYHKNGLRRIMTDMLFL
ncbi:hypothetical protein PQ689_00655 [Thermoanaerobacterium thermosaccharolyticum]|uniref:GNAT family N-acetyltransferase n=1 Tax=Thermoanaerobacterium thermosaccharolyticum TaxID=1517 RepID=UPI003DA7DE84